MTISSKIMVTFGRAAVAMGVMKADEVQRIPISIKAKNIFFDRHPQISEARMNHYNIQIPSDHDKLWC